MKRNIIKSILALAVMFTSASCETDYYNDKYLDGYENKDEITDVQTQTMTLSEEDYKSIANNYANKNMAEEAGLSAELKNLTTQQYFTDLITAEQYIPAFLEDTFNYLSVGSKIDVTYNKMNGAEAVLSYIASASEYTLTADDYAAAWGEETNGFFTEDFTAESNIPAILSTSIPGAGAGEYYLVSYEYTESAGSNNGGNGGDGNGGGTDEPDEPQEPSYTDIADLVAGSTYTVKATVVNTTLKSMLIKDDSGYVLVFFGTEPTYNIGDVITVEGAVAAYAGALQFTSSAVITKVDSESVTHPTPEVMSGADLDAYLDNVTIKYVKYTGTLVKDGNYTNITVEGTTKASPSISYVSDAVCDPSLDGQSVDVYGYLIGVSGSSYVQTMATSVVAEGTAISAPAATIAKAAVSTKTRSLVYLFDGSKWSLVDNTIVVNKDDYQAMGSSYTNFSASFAPEDYIPTLLTIKFPYAQEEDFMNVAYKFYASSVTALRADRYKFVGGEWTLENNITTEVGPYSCSADGWIYDPSMEITLTVGRDQESSYFYQTMVDIVKEEHGEVFVSSYGTNEYYCGASAYQGNISWRYDDIAEGWAAGGIDFSSYDVSGGTTAISAMYDQAIVHLTEVFGKALAVNFPDMAPVEGMDVTFKVNFAIFFGRYGIIDPTYQIVFKVVGKGEYEFVELINLNPEYDVYSSDNLNYVVKTYGGAQ